MKFPGFIGAAYTAASKTLDAQRCINLYPEMDQEGKNVIALFPTPGKSSFSTIGTGPIRGQSEEISGYIYVVSGTDLYQVTTGGVGTSLGIITGTDRVSMAYNGTQIFIATGSVGYILTVSTLVLAQITDPDFPGAVKVGYVDGYFIFIPPDSQEFFITALNDGSDINALDFASAEGAPDLNVSMIVSNREVWLLGDKSVEVFWDSGAADFPFERVSGGFIEVGCAARDSVAKTAGGIYWLGKNNEGQGIIYRATGYSPQRISNHAVEHAIAQYSDISDAVGYTYQYGGHTFYVLNFPTGNETWVFDEATGMWHQRAYRNTVTGELERDLGNFHSLFNGYNIVGDYALGILYKLDHSVRTDNGNPIKRLRSSPHVYQERKKISYSQLQVEFEPGVGLSTGQGSDPQAVLRFSNDGGFTWSTERFASMGKIGEYTNRTIWRRLGMGRDRVFEVSTTDPVNCVMVDASIEMTVHNG